ncbi:MAG: CoA-binding protein [Deltaproteobacteria bacterium]|jgi:hypothetical protein|nr:CoA-binding protein [Deltaproteobacteria bacterium]
MAGEKEAFWEQGSFAFVGHKEAKAFPTLSYSEARKRGKKVFAVDPSVDEIEGDPTYEDLSALPEKVDGVVLEVPKEETEGWVRQAADLGIGRVWIHMGRDTPEALALARDKGLEVHKGTCAVMYLSQGFSVHAIHKAVAKLTRSY